MALLEERKQWDSEPLAQVKETRGPRDRQNGRAAVRSSQIYEIN